MEPAEGDASESKRQQLLGLTILTLGVLQVRIVLCLSRWGLRWCCPHVAVGLAGRVPHLPLCG